jgi:hypothetical protein
VVEKRDQDDDRDRNAKKPKQNSTAHLALLCAAWRECWRLTNSRLPKFVPEALGTFCGAQVLRPSSAVRPNGRDQGQGPVRLRRVLLSDQAFAIAVAPSMLSLWENSLLLPRSSPRLSPLGHLATTITISFSQFI